MRKVFGNLKVIKQGRVNLMGHPSRKVLSVLFETEMQCKQKCTNLGVGGDRKLRLWEPFFRIKKNIFTFLLQNKKLIHWHFLFLNSNNKIQEIPLICSQSFHCDDLSILTRSSINCKKHELPTRVQIQYIKLKTGNIFVRNFQIINLLQCCVLSSVQMMVSEYKKILPAIHVT